MRLTTVAALLFLLSCGTSEPPPEFRICSEYTATWQVYDALVSLGYEPHGWVYFIRDIHAVAPGMEVPWVDYRLRGIPPSDPEVGYGSLCWPGHGIYINRCGSKEGHLLSLLVHEMCCQVLGVLDGVSGGSDEDVEGLAKLKRKVWERL